MLQKCELTEGGCDRLQLLVTYIHTLLTRCKRFRRFLRHGRCCKGAASTGAYHRIHSSFAHYHTDTHMQVRTCLCSYSHVCTVLCHPRFTRHRDLHSNVPRSVTPTRIEHVSACAPLSACTSLLLFIQPLCVHTLCIRVPWLSSSHFSKHLFFHRSRMPRPRRDRQLRTGQRTSTMGESSSL